MPKKTNKHHLGSDWISRPQDPQDSQALSRKPSQERKAEQVKKNTERAAANRAAGITPKRQTRKRNADNMRRCLRCNTRQIVAGSVCWCRNMGVDQKSLRDRA